MEEIYQRNLIDFKGTSLRKYRIRTFEKKFAWMFIILAILLMPLRFKNRKTISVLGMLGLSALTAHTVFA